MTQTGVKLDTGNDVYEIRKDLLVDENHNYDPVFGGGGGGQFTALFERWLGSTGGQSGVDDSPLQQANISFGAGTRSFNIEAVVAEGSSLTFGGASSSDSATKRLQHLADDFANSIYDSNNPITFEWEEYSDSGKFGPLNVVPSEIDIDVNYQEDKSGGNLRLTLVESADLNETIDDIGAGINDLFLKPFNNSTPRIPLPVDTLGLGAQNLPQDLAESGLVSVNGASGSPASLPTKILPESIQLRGAFRGAEVPTIVDTVKSDILKKDTVEKVEVVAPNNTPELDALTGSFALGPDSFLDPINPGADGIYGFEFDLREA